MRLALFVWTLCGFVLAACSNDVIIANPVRSPPLVEERSARVGVYYGPNLRNHSCVVNKGYIAEEWLISLGPTSIAMFNRVLDGLFSEVTVLRDDPRRFRRGAGDGFVVIELEAFDGCDAEWPITGSATMQVIFGAEFFDGHGTQLGQLKVSGTAGPRDYKSAPALEVETKYLSDLIEAALRRAAAELIVQVDRDPRISMGLEER